jgi:CheY-like chemotaxis protein
MTHANFDEIGSLPLTRAVADDLAQLLRAITGQVDSLLEGLPAGDPRRTSMQAISEAADRAAALLDQLPILYTVEEARDTPAERPKASIIVVEDNRGVRELVVTVLTRNGFDVRSAVNAEDALRLESERPCDVLLTDVLLPAMSGAELAQEIRHRSPRTRVLYMSGYTGTQLDESRLSREEAFLQKPFTPKTLLDRLTTLLERE